MPDDAPAPTLREAFGLRCFYNGISDQATVERLWVEDVAKREAAGKAAEEKRKADRAARKRGPRRSGRRKAVGES